MSTPQSATSAPPTWASPTGSSSKRKALDEAIGQICLDWWADLNAVDPKTGDDRKDKRRDAGAIAQLRRIDTVEGSAGEEIDTAYAVSLSQDNGPPPYKHLRNSLKGKLSKWNDDYVRGIPERPDFDAAVAVVAATLARVREHEKGEVARRLGAKTSNTAPLMAEARFKRLIRTTTAPDLLDQGRRIVALLKRSAPVDDLGASLLLWHVDPYAKRRWSFAYYDAEDMRADLHDPDATADAAPTSGT